MNINWKGWRLNQTFSQAHMADPRTITDHLMRITQRFLRKASSSLIGWRHDIFDFSLLYLSVHYPRQSILRETNMI